MTVGREAKPRIEIRWGIGQKLLLVLALFTGLTLGSNSLAVILFGHLQQTYAEITAGRIPAVIAALNMAAAGTELGVMIPAMADAGDEALPQLYERVGERTRRLNDSVERIAALGALTRSEAGQARELMDDLTAKAATVHAKAMEVQHRAAERRALLLPLQQSFLRFQSQGRQTIDRAIYELRQPNAAPALADASGGIIEAMIAMNQIMGLISQAAEAGNADDLGRLSTQFSRLSAKVAETYGWVRADLAIGDLERASSTVLQAGSIFAIRAAELSAQAAARATAQAARDVAASLASRGDEIASASRGAAEKADRDAGRASTATQAGLVAIALVCIALSAVIALAYVWPQIVRPLRDLTEVMRRLAQRDWNAVVPERKQADEIGAMSSAVSVLRQAGIDGDRLQQRIELQRQEYDDQRQRQETLLATAIGQIVASAAMGKLDGRIDTSQLQGVMQQLGDGLNALLTAFSDVVSELNRVLDGMAHGDLTRRVEGQYRGLFADLQANTNETAVRLADILQHISASAHAVKAAAGEISAGSADLASRTEQQAASLEQTAAAMHQITATVKQNAANAEAASRLADKARGTADAGGAVSADAMRAMAEIEQAAQRIADIVGLIDEIAFQTNLLALNASVEAARAGEAGKGFAVVAQEVRSLAQRSANASKDIKDLIQRSNAKVLAGGELVNRAGSSLSEIVVSVKKVADIVAEIAAASREQAVGLEDVNRAMASMDAVTQRNGALVEETTASAQSLASEADQLHGMIGRFRA